MTYHTIETTSLTNEVDSNLPKEETSHHKWLGAVATALLLCGGTMLVSFLSSSSSSNGNAIRYSETAVVEADDVYNLVPTTYSEAALTTDIFGTDTMFDQCCSTTPDGKQHGCRRCTCGVNCNCCPEGWKACSTTC